MPQDWLRVLKGIRPNPRQVAAGETLYRAGQAADALFHLSAGRIGLNHNGVRVHTIHSGQLFAETALFTPMHSCDAVAEQASRVEAYPVRAVLMHLKVHSDLNLAFSAYLVRQLDAARACLEIARHHSARDKVLAFFGHHASEGMVALDRPLTQVAAEIGMTREALYRTLRKLEKEGALCRVSKREFSFGFAPGPASAR